MLPDLSPEEEDEWRRLSLEYFLARDRLAAFERRNHGRSYHPFSREMIERAISADVKPLWPDGVPEA
jgi:hypothetical protein